VWLGGGRSVGGGGGCVLGWGGGGGVFGGSWEVIRVAKDWTSDWKLSAERKKCNMQNGRAVRSAEGPKQRQERTKWGATAEDIGGRGSSVGRRTKELKRES